VIIPGLLFAPILFLHKPLYTYKHFKPLERVSRLFKRKFGRQELEFGEIGLLNQKPKNDFELQLKGLLRLPPRKKINKIRHGEAYDL